jgi:hypothetical protein
MKIKMGLMERELKTPILEKGGPKKKDETVYLYLRTC